MLRVNKGVSLGRFVVITVLTRRRPQRRFVICHC